jgi:hypothetical protein
MLFLGQLEGWYFDRGAVFRIISILDDDVVLGCEMIYGVEI